MKLIGIDRQIREEEGRSDLSEELRDGMWELEVVLAFEASARAMQLWT